MAAMVESPMPESAIAEAMKDANAARRARAVIIPREHGAWGLLLIPLFTGIAAGVASNGQVLPLILFFVCALCLFWLRTPVESLLGSTPIVARTPQERRTAWLASVGLSVLSIACLALLFWGGRNLKLMLFGAIAATAFVVQTVLRKMGRETRMASQLVGAIGLTATAPAACYLGSGHVDVRGLTLWAANWLFAWNQIHFVQTRIHTARAMSTGEKWIRGKNFLIAEALLLLGLMICALRHMIPWLVAVAFLPTLARGVAWFVIPTSGSLDVKKLGWSEMKQGVVFGVLLAIAFLYS